MLRTSVIADSHRLDELAPRRLVGVQLADGRTADVELADGVVDHVDVPAQAIIAGRRTLPLEGHVLLPAFADPHVHLDKAFTSELVANPRGDLAGAVAAWRAYRQTQTVAGIAARARRAALELLRAGTTAVRAHVDAGPDLGLRAVEALAQVRGELIGVVDLQIVAGLSGPYSGRAGLETLALGAEALALGADHVGGAPHLDPDPGAALDGLLDLAASHGAGLDLHLDETLDPAVFTLPLLLDRVAGGFPGPVAVGHLVSLAVQPLAVQVATAARVAAAGVAVAVLPRTDLYRHGRGAPGAAPRGLTAVRILLDAGVTVAAGADNVRDPFSQTGRLDPLETASLLVTAGNVSPSEALRTVTGAARAALDLPVVDVVAGSPAELVAIVGTSLADVVAGASVGRVVLHEGRVVSRTRIETSLTHVVPANGYRM